MENSYVLKKIKEEERRQMDTIELIASENFVSDNILKALGSCLTNKYTEGYPAKREMGNKGRYYGGCRYYDEIEEYCISLWKEVFCTEYHVNVQPHSGSQANMAAYNALLNPGDTVLSLDLNSGGHITHGSPVNFSGKLYNFISYGLNEKGFIDFEKVEELVSKLKPNLVVVGASAYSREIQYSTFFTICSYYGVKMMVDMAHPAGLIATGLLQSPFEMADVITTTTHKTLRGPRGGLIFCKPELAKKIDSAVFPGIQGGSLQNVIAAKAICAEEVLTESYYDYMVNVQKNSREMAKKFMELGYKVVTDGTDNHMFLIDLTDTGLTGKQVQDELDKHMITLNKNTIPGEKRSPKETSGIRIGTAAMTTRGYDAADFRHVARTIDKIIKKI